MAEETELEEEEEEEAELGKWEDPFDGFSESSPGIVNYSTCR